MLIISAPSIKLSHSSTGFKVENMYLGARIGLVYLVLFAVAVPWYWRFMPTTAMTICLGMPLWVIFSIAASFLISLVTAGLICCRWPEDVEDRGEDRFE